MGLLYSEFIGFGMMGSHKDIAEDLNEYRMSEMDDILLMQSYAVTTAVIRTYTDNYHTPTVSYRLHSLGKVLEYWYGSRCPDLGKLLKVLQSFSCWWQFGTSYWRGQTIFSTHIVIRYNVMTLHVKHCLFEICILIFFTCVLELI